MRVFELEESCFYFTNREVSGGKTEDFKTARKEAKRRRKEREEKEEEEERRVDNSY